MRFRSLASGFSENQVGQEIQGERRGATSAWNAGSEHKSSLSLLSTEVLRPRSASDTSLLLVIVAVMALGDETSEGVLVMSFRTFVV